MASVSLRGVTKSYPGGVQALDNLDLEVEDCEFLVLLGPSGCGKSTTLRLIAGLDDVTAGEVRIDGRVVNGVPPKDRDIAMVFQNYALYPHMSVYRNMAFGLQLRYGGNYISRIWRRLHRPAEAAEWAVQRRSIPGRVRETAQTLGIEPLLDRMPRELSGGERQRVALGRAMVRHPAVFLFDEPLSNLDAKLRLETRRELKRLHGQLETTMIYVTHDQTEALTLGQRIAILDRGRLQQVGTPEAVYRQPANRFVAGFIGSPPMNLLEATLREEGARLQLTGTEIEFPLAESWRQRFALQRPPSDHVILGIRPEHLRLADPAAEAEVASCPAVVTLVEPLGDTVYVHAEVVPTGEAQKNSRMEFVCKTAGDQPPRLGAAVRLVFEPTRIQLFDARTGRSLGSDV